jgi:hydroxyethylthiazole kinase-like uncharacterized protein yjeF
MELLTAAQMRAIEAAAIASGRVTGLALMERAGQGVVDAILAEWPELAGAGRGALPPGAADAALPPGYLGQDEGEGAPPRAVVLCGPGNNGGDGFVVARLLKARGWQVEVFLYGDPARLPPDARVNHDRWCGLGEVRPLGALVSEDALRWLEEVQRTGSGELFAVDALFGTGLTRPLATGDIEGIEMFLVNIDDLWLHGGPTPRWVAIDVPSGLCADSGRVLAPDDPDDPGGVEQDPRFFAVQADLTVAFHAEKLGHRLDIGPRLCGKVVVADIGLPRPHPSVARWPTVEKVVLPGPPWPTHLKKYAGHKYTHGHALILSGPPGHGGAARLAARGALRIGAGVVTVGCPPEAVPEHAARLDAIMLRGIGTVEGLRVALEDARINALCIGPGLGLDARGREIVAGGLASGRPVVLDADALTHIAGAADLFAALHPACILTPHPGEFARLFPDIAAKLNEPATRGPAYSKVDAARDAARRAGCVVLFKGPDTVIADPAGRCAVNSAHYDRAAPWLATAGTGDVLAGFITGLLARGLVPMDAAQTAAWLHVECARSFGPGLIAEDLPEELPRVFRALGL